MARVLGIVIVAWPIATASALPLSQTWLPTGIEQKITLAGETMKPDEPGSWVRYTACFRRIGGNRVIAHEQISAPVDPVSGRAFSRSPALIVAVSIPQLPQE